MRYAFIAIRNGQELTPVLGPVPEAEAVEEFKARSTADHQAEGADGQFHGALELYELRARRSYKLRVPAKSEVGSGKSEVETAPATTTKPKVPKGKNASAEPPPSGEAPPPPDDDVPQV